MKNNTSDILTKKPNIKKVSTILKEASLIGMLAGGLLFAFFLMFGGVSKSIFLDFSSIYEFFAYCFFSSIVWIGETILYLKTVTPDKTLFCFSVILALTSLFTLIKSIRQIHNAETFIDNMIDSNIKIRAYWDNLSEKEKKYPKNKNVKFFMAFAICLLLLLSLLVDASFNYIFSENFMFQLMFQDFLDVIYNLDFTIDEAKEVYKTSASFIVFICACLFPIILSFIFMINITYNINHLVEYAKTLD